MNRRILLAERPAGIPGPEYFRADEEPVRPPGAGELVVETVYISIDPAMRRRPTSGNTVGPT